MGYARRAPNPDDSAPDHRRQRRHSNTQGASMTEWYYEQAGSRRGPMDEAAMLAAYQSGNVGENTLVWNKEFGADWRKMRDSGLLMVEDIGPPRLPPSHVNNNWAWLIALIPLVGYASERLFAGIDPVAYELYDSSKSSSYVYAAIYIGLCLIDSKAIESSGYNLKHVRLVRWVWIIPLYLYKRAKALGQKQYILIIWIFSFTASMIIQYPNLLSISTYFSSSIPSCSSLL